MNMERFNQYPFISLLPAILIFFMVSHCPSLEYVIGVDDVLNIKLWMDPDMSGEWLVKENGNINYPILGEVKLAGLTLEEARVKLTEQLIEYYKDPQVNITVTEYGSCEVYVLGEVKTPGVVTYKREATVLEAILKAGGFTDSSRRSSTILIRNIDEDVELMRIDLESVIDEGLISLNIIVQPGDIVYVPSRYISDLNQFLTDISPSMFAFLRVHSMYKLQW